MGATPLPSRTTKAPRRPATNRPTARRPKHRVSHHILPKQLSRYETSPTRRSAEAQHGPRHDVAPYGSVWLRATAQPNGFGRNQHMLASGPAAYGPPNARIFGASLVFIASQLVASGSGDAFGGIAAAEQSTTIGGRWTRRAPAGIHTGKGSAGFPGPSESSPPEAGLHAPEGRGSRSVLRSFRRHRVPLLG